ncbi:Homoserine dehydrogenase, partial [Coemansia furcata]
MLNIAIVGPGLVGGALIEQLVAHTQSPRFASLPIAVVGLINSKKMALSKTAFTAADLAQYQTTLLGSTAEPADMSRFSDTLGALRCGATAVVDCTSSDGVASLYPMWLTRGLHVVTPNKKAFSGYMSLFREIEKLASSPLGPSVYHEAT